MELKDSSTTSFDFQMEASGSRQIHHSNGQDGAAGAKGNESVPWIISHVWSAAPELMDAVSCPGTAAAPSHQLEKHTGKILFYFFPFLSLFSSFQPAESPRCWELLHRAILDLSNSCPGSG